MIRKSGNRFSKKIMLKQGLDDEHGSTQLKHALGRRGVIISGERNISYPEIHARIARAASGFRALGVGGGKPVAMMLRNDFAFFEVSGAAAALGSPVVPINWHLKSEEVAYILADSGAEILVCHADLLPQIRDRLPGHIRLLVVT